MISIIVPIYNAEQSLVRCLDSIVNQSYQDIEVLLVDDGSTDRSGSICDEYAARDERVKAYHLENGGVSRARNYGLEKATGAYIGFVDSDDWIEVDMYQRLLEALQQNRAELAVCSFIHEFVGGAAARTEQNGETRLYTAEQSGIYRAVLYSKEIGGFLCNKLFYKEFITKKLNEDIAQCEDMIFVLEYCVSVKRLVQVRSGLYHYIRENERDVSRYNARDKTLMAAYENILQLCEKNAPDCVPEVRTRALKIYLNYRARYKLTNDNDRETKQQIDNGIKRYLKCVLSDHAVHMKAKLNILATYLAPRFMLKSKKRIIYKLQQKGVWQS